MRKDLVGGGGATLSLMLIAYVLLQSASLPVPGVITDVALLVAVLGALLLVIGVILPSRARRR